jgi:hypothetical protein
VAVEQGPAVPRACRCHLRTTNRPGGGRGAVIGGCHRPAVLAPNTVANMHLQPEGSPMTRATCSMSLGTGVLFPDVSHRMPKPTAKDTFSITGMAYLGNGRQDRLTSLMLRPWRDARRYPFRRRSKACRECVLGRTTGRRNPAAGKLGIVASDRFKGITNGSRAAERSPHSIIGTAPIPMSIPSPPSVTNKPRISPRAWPRCPTCPRHDSAWKSC